MTFIYIFVFHKPQFKIIVMEISKNKTGRYAMLRNKKYRDREGLFLVQGVKAVNDTLGLYDVEAIILGPGAVKLPEYDDFTVLEAKESDLKKISSLENTPDVIAIYRIPEPADRSLPVEKGEFSLVLDGVQDPGNLGTIVRTAHWFGIKNIFCSPDTVDLYNPKVVQSTMGSISKVRVIYCDIPALFDANPEMPVYGLLLHGKDIYRETHLKAGFIVMGSEGHGPGPEVCKRITTPLTIPPADPQNHPDSLNVAIATAITLSTILHR